jgi:DNA-binding response OmpR family regulator
MHVAHSKVRGWGTRLALPARGCTIFDLARVPRWAIVTNRNRPEAAQNPLPMPGSARVLVVEDEPAIAETVAYALRREGFGTEVATDLSTAYQRRRDCDLILLDLMLPDGSGFDLIGKLRAEGSTLPIIVLSSRDSEADRVAALESGADDYVTKPFSPREVVARVRAVLRRSEGAHDERARPALPLRVEQETRRAFHKGVALELTKVEFDLLAQMLVAPGRVLARSELIDKVWGDGFAITDRTIDSHIKSLRRKVAEVGGSPQLIETVRGVGYRVRDDGD